MSMTPNICILKTDGINCDQELSYAFKVAGANPQTIHINQIRSGERRLADYDGLGLPGGFSYGDDIASGAVLANELTAYLGDALQEFADAKKPIIGICNGFQVLTRTGLLPDKKIGEQTATLARNESGTFICKWTELGVIENVCKFTPIEAFEDTVLPIQIAHGEGRFMAGDDTLSDMADNGQVVFRYRQNPNGSSLDIAGVCDESGTVLGMMPHPERSVTAFHPDRSRTDAARRGGAIIFEKFVNYARQR